MKKYRIYWWLQGLGNCHIRDTDEQLIFRLTIAWPWWKRYKIITPNGNDYGEATWTETFIREREALATAGADSISISGKEKIIAKSAFSVKRNNEDYGQLRMIERTKFLLRPNCSPEEATAETAPVLELDEIKGAGTPYWLVTATTEPHPLLLASLALTLRQFGTAPANKG